eukprot:CAMPEP_0185733746 /NCGR_PEP_ID=MMETSP1171-20130828/20391_1 /TAXON_ID=374046 /ORGANISM="Helicotheca tamensis, Strain CCMP826" /LENGTH=201 /DNA_ID=CAMNT_0028403549 /DNA_START=92 /DNA_END=694 /DNA_ORIENTATION=+
MSTLKSENDEYKKFNGDVLATISSYCEPNNGLVVLRLAKTCKDWFDALRCNRKMQELAYDFFRWKRYTLTMRWRRYGGKVCYQPEGDYDPSFVEFSIPREYNSMKRNQRIHNVDDDEYSQENIFNEFYVPGEENLDIESYEVYFQGELDPELFCWTKKAKDYQEQQLKPDLFDGDNELNACVVPRNQLGNIDADVVDFGCW